jgi:hypothetical protein
MDAVRLPRTPLWDRRDRDLSSKQRRKKAAFLEAQSLARRGKVSLDEALKQRKLHRTEALRNTSSVKIVHGKLVPKVSDKTPRSLRIYEKGKRSHVEVANSRVASDIGRYWNAVGILTETGNSKALRYLHRQRFKDIHGRIHTLEKDPKVILELEARKPKPESIPIYKS